MSLRQIGPYGFVAGLCVLAHFLILVCGERLGAHFIVSTTISFIVCIAIGYSLHSRFTFIVPASLWGLARYTLAMALNYPLSIVAVWFFYQFLDQPMILAAPGSTLVLTIYNFLSSRWAIASYTSEVRTEKAAHDRNQS